MLRFDTHETQTFWKQACAAIGLDPTTTHHAGTFAEPTTPDRAAFIDELAGMARDASKRGTAHMQLQFDTESIPMRAPGDCWIVTTTAGSPLCVVRVTAVEVRPFNQVTEAFAASEGEGDLSVEHWRNVHGAYFQRQCARWGCEWRDDHPVVCESFELIYP